MTEHINVLVSLHRGYGLGDAVQMSSVLRHVAKYRPNWRVDYRAEAGKEVVGRGIVANTFAYGEEPPTPHYDAEVEVCLYDTWSNWGDRPNTRVSSCLHERFGLWWDAECGQYRVDVSQGVRHWAEDVVLPNSVAVHYQGDSDKARKDLSSLQADLICAHIRSLGCVPYMLGRHIPKGYDAEVNCAIIGQCRAFVGIDSGPSKCASATVTPALVTWTGHHPAPFHDPAPNTTHLVPSGYNGLEPVCSDSGVVRWFEANYNVCTYELDPVEEIKQWLTKTLSKN
jgi:hypothetical protein